MTQTKTSRVAETLAQLTLEEKAALTVGRDAWTTVPIERLGVPSVWLSDGPTGLRKARGVEDMGLGASVPATCFPTESALGASWDVDLVCAVAGAIASEAQAEGVHVVLGPGVNLKRSPLCGRNFEYFAEDPVLSGELAAAFVTGLQEQGVGACVKHLVANESETDRMITDSVVNERALRELYLRPFEIAIAKAAPWSLMAAYNRLNGTYCAEHPRLLRDIVAGEWGYSGVVISDWFAVNDRAAGVAAGLHLQMPSAPTADAVVAAVREGHLAEERLDEIVCALLVFISKAGAARRQGAPADLDAHHRLARRAAGESVVLLKNEGALLPLEGDALSEVAVIGLFAREPRYQGAGSSQVVPTRPAETLHDELVALIGPTGRVTYAAGYGEDGVADPALLDEAREAAQRARTAVVVVGLPGSYEEEGADRARLDLPPGHTALVEAVLEAQPRAVVVLLNGSAVTLPWAERSPALVEGWLGGQAGGGAIADVLLGRVNPSGKLAETFPARLEDTPAYLSFPDDGTGRVPFAEGLFTGYRWYDARRIAPLFPFGHGLSYTTFSYSDLTVEQPAAPGRDGAGRTVAVSLTVRNTGGRAGREVVQTLRARAASASATPGQGTQGVRQGCSGIGRGDRGALRAGRARLCRLRPTGRRVGAHELGLRHPRRRVLARHPRAGERDADQDPCPAGTAGAIEPTAGLAGPPGHPRQPAAGDRRPAATVLRRRGCAAGRGVRERRLDQRVRGGHAHRQAGHVRRVERGRPGAPDRGGERPRHRQRAVIHKGRSAGGSVSAISYQLSAISYQLSATRYPLPATRYPLPATRYPLPGTRYPVPGLTSPAWTGRSVPSGKRTSRAPSASTSAATPSKTLSGARTEISRPIVDNRSRHKRSTAAGSRAARSTYASSASSRSSSSGSRAMWRPVAPASEQTLGRSGAALTLMPMPITTAHDDPTWSSSSRIPPTLASSTSTSFGHLRVQRDGPTTARTVSPAARAEAMTRAGKGKSAVRRSNAEAARPARGGAIQRRPWRPRPCVCSSASTTVPSRAPIRARARAAMFVEPMDG